MTNNPNQQSTRTEKDVLSMLAIDFLSPASESNEKLLLILNRNSGLAPYSHEFQETSSDPQVISGFISAMTSFMGFVTGGQQSSWKTVYGTDSVILVETGEWTFGVLAVSRETNEARNLLKRVITEFEDCFEVLKNSDGIDGSAYGEFDQFARQVFVDDRVTGRTLVMKRPKRSTLLSSLDLPSATFTLSKILLSQNEVQTVQEIAEYLSLPIDLVIEHVSKAFWKNVVDLLFVPADDDILILSEGASTFLFQKTNPFHLADESLKVIAQFDGRTKLSHLMRKSSITEMKRILEDLGNLINRGFIQRISEMFRLALRNECILSSLSLKGSQLIGQRNVEHFFYKICEVGCKQHPWINRIKLSDQMEVHFIFEGSSPSNNLSEILEALEYAIEELKDLLSTMCGRNVIDRLLCGIITSCNDSWILYQTDVGNKDGL